LEEIIFENFNIFQNNISSVKMDKVLGYFYPQFKDERRATTRKGKNPCTLQYICPNKREKYNTYAILYIPLA